MRRHALIWVTDGIFLECALSQTQKQYVYDKASSSTSSVRFYFKIFAHTHQFVVCGISKIVSSTELSEVIA